MGQGPKPACPVPATPQAGQHTGERTPTGAGHTPPRCLPRAQVVCGISVAYCCTIPSQSTSQALSAALVRPPPNWRDQWQRRHSAAVESSSSGGGKGGSRGEEGGGPGSGEGSEGEGEGRGGSAAGGPGTRLSGGEIAGIGELGWAGTRSAGTPAWEHSLRA